MKVTKLDSRIIKYKLVDAEHGVHYYTLDLDRYQLSISGETVASYKWVETPTSESFLKLMVRCDKWYLLDKMFNKIFDIEASKKSIKDYIKECYEDEDGETIESIFEDIDGIDCDGIDYFINAIERILTNHYLLVEFYDLYACIEKKFKHWDEKSIDLFCEYIKPELKNELESEDTE